MKRTLEFSPELENRLQVLAAQNGTSVEAFILHAVEMVANGAQSIEAQPARELSGFGAAAHLAPRAADVNRERRLEPLEAFKNSVLGDTADRRKQGMLWKPGCRQSSLTCLFEKTL